jgi:predicted nucleotidyltransferase
MSTTTTISRNGITLPMEQIAEFCRRWKIRELAVFGSFLRDDFRPDSDLDFLYTFVDDVRWTLFDLDTMEQEPHPSAPYPQHCGGDLCGSRTECEGTDRHEQNSQIR